jgi:hypothetical protein
MAPEKFDVEEFARYLAELSDAEIVNVGRSVCSSSSRWMDSAARDINKMKYRLCKKEWSRRHPTKDSTRSRTSEDRPPRSSKPVVAL